MFTEVGANPMTEWVKGDEEWMCFPLKVGSLLCYTYFHRDFDRRSREALANLFELASDEDCIGASRICFLFGNPDDQNDTVFYHDQANAMWVGKVSYGDVIEYFGYLKK